MNSLEVALDVDINPLMRLLILLDVYKIKKMMIKTTQVTRVASHERNSHGSRWVFLGKVLQYDVQPGHGDKIDAQPVEEAKREEHGH